MRTRAGLGLLGGALLLASSLAHALLGWPQMRTGLRAGGADPELIAGLGVGWHFGSLSMAAFGAIVLAIAGARLRGQRASALPVAVIALTYLSFGTWAYLARGGNPHFLGFIAIGLLLVPLGLARRGV